MLERTRSFSDCRFWLIRTKMNLAILFIMQLEELNVRE
jgi:hypothetical protein